MLQNLDAKVIITNAAHAATLRALDIPDDKMLLVEQAMVAEAAYDNAALLQRLEALVDTDPYCIIHTSGSTGVPKGVALNHRSTIDFVDWAFERLGLDGSEVMGSLAPIYFDAYTLEFCLCLAKGATWVVVPEQLAMFPAKLVEFVATQPINFIFWVPTIMVNIANLDLLAKIEAGPAPEGALHRRGFPNKASQLLAAPPAGGAVCQSLRPDRDHGGLHLLHRGSRTGGRREDAGRIPVPQHGHPDSQRAEPAREGGRTGGNLRARQFAGPGLLEQPGANRQRLCPESAQLRITRS